MADAIQAIDLWPTPYECVICDADTIAKHGIAVYEDIIVPDDYEGEWGGAPACELCFAVVRGLQSEHPGKFVEFAAVRDLLRTRDTERVATDG